MKALLDKCKALCSEPKQCSLFHDCKNYNSKELLMQLYLSIALLRQLDMSIPSHSGLYRIAAVLYHIQFKATEEALQRTFPWRSLYINSDLLLYYSNTIHARRKVYPLSMATIHSTFGKTSINLHYHNCMQCLTFTQSKSFKWPAFCREWEYERTFPSTFTIRNRQFLRNN